METVLATFWYLVFGYDRDDWRGDDDDEEDEDED